VKFALDKRFTWREYSVFYWMPAASLTDKSSQGGFMRFVVLSIAASLLASVATAQTYDFTGVVTEYNQYLSTINAIGTPVTGSFTIAYANAQSVTAPPGSATFTASETSGPYVDNALTPPPTVFSMTLQAIGGVNYATPSGASAAANLSSVSGSNGLLTAAEQTYVRDGFFPTTSVDFSSVSLHGFNANGLPAPGAYGTGRIEQDLIDVYYNTVSFTISGLTEIRAPELDAPNGIAALALLSICILIWRGRRLTPRAGTAPHQSCH
jgi:hypothetical protein